MQLLRQLVRAGHYNSHLAVEVARKLAAPKVESKKYVVEKSKVKQALDIVESSQIASNRAREKPSRLTKKPLLRLILSNLNAIV